MNESDKQKLVSQFNEMANVAQQVSLPVAQGMRLGSLVAQLGQTIDALKTDAPHLAAVPEAS